MIDGGHTQWKLSAWIQNDISKHFITLQPFICHVHKHKWMHWLHYRHLGCRGGMALLNKISPMNTALKYIKTDFFFFFPYIYLLRILFCFFFPFDSLLFKSLEALVLCQPRCCTNPVSFAPSFFSAGQYQFHL